MCKRIKSIIPLLLQETCHCLHSCSCCHVLIKKCSKVYLLCIAPISSKRKHSLIYFSIHRGQYHGKTRTSYISHTFICNTRTRAILLFFVGEIQWESKHETPNKFIATDYVDSVLLILRPIPSILGKIKEAESHIRCKVKSAYFVISITIYPQW